MRGDGGEIKTNEEMERDDKGLIKVGEQIEKGERRMTREWKGCVIQPFLSPLSGKQENKERIFLVF